MPTLVMMVVLLAALLHATWNFLVKSTEDKEVSMSAVVLGHTPFAVAALLFAPNIDLSCWPYALAGALLHTGYQIFLLASYRIGDLSQVYPLARGVAPLLVAVISVLFLHVALTTTAILGIAVIATGIMSLTLVRREGGLRNTKAARLSIITGCFIASYSLVDGLGAREAGSAVGFYGLLSILNAVLFSLAMAWRRPGTLGQVFQSPKLALAGGGASFAAYAMVIWAFTMAPIAMVTALRETSIIFALLLGVGVLKEPLNLTKLASTFLTMLGAGLLKAGRG